MVGRDGRDESGGSPPFSRLSPRQGFLRVANSPPSCAAGRNWTMADHSPQLGRPGSTESLRCVLCPQLVDLARCLHSGSHYRRCSSRQGSLLDLAMAATTTLASRGLGLRTSSKGAVWMRNGVWSFVEQGLGSCSNQIISILVARSVV